MQRKNSKEYAEISNSQAVRILGSQTALLYFMQDLFKIYQSRNGQYCIKYERRKYSTTDKIDSYGYGALYLKDVVEDLLNGKGKIHSDRMDK